MSPIKVAFIPPKGMETRMHRGDLVMCLGQLAHGPYLEAVRSSKKPVIMDNGVNEGEELSSTNLVIAQKLVDADELVLPDVLEDSKGTFEATTNFLNQYELPGKNYMGVVQGKTEHELHQLVEQYAKRRLSITTLGLPRLLLRPGHISIRIDLANWILENFPKRFQIHLLGASALWVKEPFYAGKYAPHIRSIDTSMPYNYALLNMRIDQAAMHNTLVNRSATYFTRAHSEQPTVLYNEEVYKSWCHGIRSPIAMSAHSTTTTMPTSPV